MGRPFRKHGNPGSSTYARQNRAKLPCALRQPPASGKCARVANPSRHLTRHMSGRWAGRSRSGCTGASNRRYGYDDVMVPRSAGKWLLLSLVRSWILASYRPPLMCYLVCSVTVLRPHRERLRRDDGHFLPIMKELTSLHNAVVLAENGQRLAQRGQRVDLTRGVGQLQSAEYETIAGAQDACRLPQQSRRFTCIHAHVVDDHIKLFVFADRLLKIGLRVAAILFQTRRVCQSRIEPRRVDRHHVQTGVEQQPCPAAGGRPQIERPALRGQRDAEDL